MKNQRGITLIALVVTIVILIILAGVAINLSVGENGLITKALSSKDKNRIALLEEEKDLWKLNKSMDNHTNDSTAQSLEDFVTKLQEKGLITQEEKKEILSTGQVTIGNKNIVFEEYIYISNKKELEDFRDNVNQGYTYENQTVVLLNDIDLDGKESDSSTWWTPIGINESITSFEGTFDGNNYSITNMYSEVTEGFTFAAFFSCIKNATIKNLTVEGEIVAGAMSSEEDNPTAAGIVGVSFGNCQIINCTNKTDISKESANRETGGILGCVEHESDTAIYNCTNEGTISGGNACGGLVGSVYGSLTVKDSYNEGNVGILYSKYVGGLVGRSLESSTSVKIYNSYNKGTITSVSYAAGVLAHVAGESLLIDNCYNEGTINLINRTGWGYAGGIIGRNLVNCSEAIIINSYNTKNINITEETKKVILGGIVGETCSNSASIVNCYNLGDLEADRTSGICGTVSGSTGATPNLNIANSYNKGTITGREYSSGIVRVHISTATINIQNTYYLDTTASVGVQNTGSDDATPLTETYMMSKEFTNDLNSNLLNLDIQFQLNTWKYVENNYPIFE